MIPWGWIRRPWYPQHLFSPRHDMAQLRILFSAGTNRTESAHHGLGDRKAFIERQKQDSNMGLPLSVGTGLYI